MNDLEIVKLELKKIQERNKKVEANKAWETSLTRKIVLFVITYFVIGLTLMTIHNPEPWINAFIPAIGFSISTLTLPFIKEYWMKMVYKKDL
jgi:hypothetical protein